MDDQPREVTEVVEGSDLREQPVAAAPSVLDTRRPRLTLTLTPRQRMRRLAGAGSSVLPALLILLAAVPGLRAGASSWLAGFVPTPTATLPPGTDRFYFLASVPAIRLSLDGRAPSPLPRLGTDAPLVLARGPHRLSWNAAPFLSQSCLLSVPFGLNDTCGTPIPVPVPLRHASVMASLVVLRESLATLSASQQRAVIAAIQHALPTSTSAIEPGRPLCARAGRHPAAPRHAGVSARYLKRLWDRRRLYAGFPAPVRASVPRLHLQHQSLRGLHHSGPGPGERGRGGGAVILVCRHVCPPLLHDPHPRRPDAHRQWGWAGGRGFHESPRAHLGWSGMTGAAVPWPVLRCSAAAAQRQRRLSPAAAVLPVE
jgi:hypothetical protein